MTKRGPKNRAPQNQPAPYGRTLDGRPLKFNEGTMLTRFLDSLEKKMKDAK